MRGSRLTPADVRFARALDRDWAVVHSHVATILPGDDETAPRRLSMQLFLLRRTDDGWAVQSLQNSRVVALERQALLDDVDGLAPDDAAVVTGLAARLGRGGAGAR